MAVAFFDAAATANDGQPYRNIYTWYFSMRDGKLSIVHVDLNRDAVRLVWRAPM